MSKRPRPNVAPSVVATILRPWVTSKRWLCYTEKLNGAVDRVAIKGKHGLVQEFLNELEFHVCLPAKLTIEAFETLATENQEQWKLSNSQCHEWAVSMSRRLRSMLRHVSQAIVKKTKWAVELFGKDAPQIDQEEGEDEEEEEQNEEQEGECDDADEANMFDTIATFCFEHGEAWRKIVPQGADSKRIKKEWTNDLFSKSDAGTAPMWARWPDGGEAELHNLLQSQWLDIKEGMSKRRGRKPPVWEGTRDGKIDLSPTEQKGQERQFL